MPGGFSGNIRYGKTAWHLVPFGMGPRGILTLLTLINLMNYVDRWLISAIVPAMQTDLGLSNTAAGLIMSAFMLGYFVTSPFFGYLTDRYNRMKLILAGTTAWSLATIFSGLGRTGLQIFSARIAVGIGEASTVSSGQAVIVDLFPRGKRNQAIAFFSAAIPVGAALGFILGGFLEHQFGWRAAFFIAGVPGFLISVPLFFLKDPKRGQFDSNGPNEKPTNFKQDVWHLFRNPLYMRSVLGYAAFTFTVGGFASWAPKYLVSVQNVSLKEADTMFGALTVVMGALGSILGGYGANFFLKRNPRGDLWFIVIGTILSIPFAFASFLLHNKTGFYSSMALAEFFLFLIQPPINVAIMESVGPLLRGTATAMAVFLIHLLGDLISPPLVGWVADHWGFEAGILILPAALFIALFFFVDGLRTSINAPLGKPIGETLT